jgi:ribonuclease G
MAYLTNLWQALAARAKRASAPSPLYRDVDLVIRIVRDFFTRDVEKFVVDSREAFSRVHDLLKYTSPELLPRLEFYEGAEDLFTCYGVEAELDKLERRQVGLKCGGSIVIDRTEALTVVDVNTGKFTGSTNLEETVFQANLDAASEIARQIRLRDIGGIIIIDFIDMVKEEHRQAVVAALAEHLKKDRTKTNLLGFTGLGLVEMTRKKARQNLEAMLHAPCPCCEGRGYVFSPETVAINVTRKLRKLVKAQQAKGRLIIQAHPLVAEAVAAAWRPEKVGKR